MKGSQRIVMAIAPLVVLAFAIAGYGFFIGCMFQGGDYYWAAGILAAVVLGTAVIVLDLSRPEVHRIRSRVANAEAIIVNDYRLVFACGKGNAGSCSVAATGRVSDVIVKVTNGDACAHRVAVGIDINDEPAHRAIRRVAVDPGATAYVAVALPRNMPLDDIRLLSIRLKQAS